MHRILFIWATILFSPIVQSATDFCEVDSARLEHISVGEVGEKDSNPRLRANLIAKEVNKQNDCVAEIDTCAVPAYSRLRDSDHIYVEISNSEILFARIVFGDDKILCEYRRYADTF